MHTLHIVLLITSAIIALLAIYTLRFRRSELGLTYFVLLVAIFMYSFGYAFEIRSTSVADIYFWLRIQYLGIAWLPTIFLILAFQYTGNGHVLKRWFVLLIVFLSVSTLVFQFTNWNQLFYKDFSINYEGQFPISTFKKGSWYWIHQVYSNLSFLVSSILYLNMVISSAGVNKIRAGIMFFTAIVPWVFYAIYLSGHSPNNIDLNPFSVTFVGILGALGIFKFQLLDFEPLALESVFESINEGVIIIDNHKRLLKYNRRATQIFGEINLKLVGKNAETALSGYFNLNELLASTANQAELAIQTNGQQRFYQIRSSEIKENINRKAGWTIILTDITKRKEIENTLAENARKLAEVDINRNRFVAILAHDLRNPLNIMTNLSDILNSELPANINESVRNTARTLYDVSYSTTYLTENLLRWAQLLRSGIQFNPQRIKLRPILMDELNLLHPQFARKKLTYQLDALPDIMIFADSDMLKTIVRNLITNAIKFSYESGEIQINARQLKSETQIEIKDQGIGIREEEQKRLFIIDNYIVHKGTGSEMGSGLGLVICKEFTDKHNGKIWVESQPEKGSSFIFTLPANA